MKIDRDYIRKMTSCNPEEFDKLMESKSFEDLFLLKDFVRIMDGNHKLLLTDGNIKKSFLKIKNLYQDLIKDGLLKIDLFSFEQSTLETMKDAQARKEIFDKKESVGKGVMPDEFFLLMNEIYSTIYETICITCLKQISEGIKGTRLITKGKMVQIVKEYKDGKYASFFKNLDHGIRNSTSHEDFYMDKKEPKITFYNRDGTVYKILSKKEYEIIVDDLLDMLMGFDRAKWDLTKELEYDLITRLESVSDWIKKKGLKLKHSKTSKTSVYDYSEMIKKGMI